MSHLQGAMGWSVSMVFLVILASLFTKSPEECSGSVVECSASDHGVASTSCVLSLQKILYSLFRAGLNPGNVPTLLIKC